MQREREREILLRVSSFSLPVSDRLVGSWMSNPHWESGELDIYVHVGVDVDVYSESFGC